MVSPHTKEYPSIADKRRDRWVIGMEDSSGQLIGTITGRPVTLSLAGERKIAFYVDLLCVKRSARNKRLASILIDKMVQEWRLANFDLNIFLKDHSPLPISHLAQFFYYKKTISPSDIQHSDIQLVKMESSQLDDALIYLTEQLKGYKLHQCFSKEEFVYYFIPRKRLVYTYLYLQDGKIVGLVNIITTNYENKVAQIVYHLGLGSNLTDQLLFNQLSEEGFDTVIAMNLDFNRPLIGRNDFEYMYKTFHHLYNYNLNIDSVLQIGASFP